MIPQAVSSEKLLLYSSELQLSGQYQHQVLARDDRFLQVAAQSSSMNIYIL